MRADRCRTLCMQLWSLGRCNLVLFLAFVMIVVSPPSSLSAQDAATSRFRNDSIGQAANYRLAGRFAPYKMQELIYSTSVTPRWIEGTERFWYEWETSDGKFFFFVDPVAGSKRSIEP